VWDESVRAYALAGEQRRRAQWLRHHTKMARVFGDLAAHHEQQAQKLAGQWPV